MRKDQPLQFCPGCKAAFPVAGYHKCPTHEFGAPALLPLNTGRLALVVQELLRECDKADHEYLTGKRSGRVLTTAWLRARLEPLRPLLVKRQTAQSIATPPASGGAHEEGTPPTRRGPPHKPFHERDECDECDAYFGDQPATPPVKGRE